MNFPENICPHCNLSNEAQANFCSRCGNSLKAKKETSTIDSTEKAHIITWKRNEQEIFWYLDKIFPQIRQVLVSHGSKALFFENGKIQEVFLPGQHKIKGIFSLWSKKNVALAFVEGGDISLKFSSKVQTKDFFRLQVDIEIILSISSPGIFFKQLIKGKKLYFKKDLHSFLEGETQEALRSFFQKKSLDQVEKIKNGKNFIESFLQKDIEYILTRVGLKLIHVQVAHYRNEKLLALKEQVGIEDYLLESELQKRQKKVSGMGKVQELELEQKLKLERKKLLFRQENQDSNVDHTIARKQKLLEFEIHKKSLLCETINQQEYQKLCAQLERKKLEIQTEGEISEIIMETQEKRAKKAMDIKKNWTLNRLETEILKQKIKQKQDL